MGQFHTHECQFLAGAAQAQAYQINSGQESLVDRHKAHRHRQENRGYVDAKGPSSRNANLANLEARHHRRTILGQRQY